ncbi:MAG: cupin domain-containing protein [Acidobacteriota bacterium]|nr:cupin domain-containing protein [Acidobacteriota bacterium]
MHQPIQLGNLTVTFLQSRHETEGAFDLFELTVPSHAFLNVPHLHRDYDETIIGIDGIATWTLDGAKTQVGPGQQLHIPGGTAHAYSNLHPKTCRMLCLLTPGLVGPEYFLEMAAILRAEGPPDIAAIGKIMTRYGVIPATA